MTLVWGVNYVVAKVALRYFPPLVFAPLRTIGAALLMIPVYLYSHKRHEAEPHPPLSRRDLAIIAAIGVAGITLNQLAFIAGIGQTSVAHAALIIATTPVQVLLLAASRGMEHLTLRKCAGLSLATAGILVLNLAPGRDDRNASFFGDFFIFLAALFFAMFTVGSKEATRRLGPVVVNSFGFAFGAFASIPLLIAAGWNYPWAEVSLGGWLSVLYMALFPSVICYLIYYHALGHMPASRVSAFSYAQPVIAAFTGWLVLGEPVTAGVLGAAALVLTGVWLAGRS